MPLLMRKLMLVYQERLYLFTEKIPERTELKLYVIYMELTYIKRKTNMNIVRIIHNIISKFMHIYKER